MKRKIVLAVVLCLAVVALLGVAAAPAAAATCTDCHAAAPDGPPAPHGVLVAAVTDCTTCHKGMSPHPDPASLLTPKLGFRAAVVLQNDGSQTFVLGGSLRAAGDGINGVLVYLQERVPGAAEFTDVAQATTHPKLLVGNGFFANSVPATAKGTTYRAIAQGVAGASVLKPGLSAEVKLTPWLELWRLRGLDNLGHMKLGRSVVAIGHAAPTWFVGEKVKLTLKKGSDLHQGVVQRVERIIREAGTLGTFRWTITPKTRGEYALYARWPATAKHASVSAVEWWFVVE